MGKRSKNKGFRLQESEEDYYERLAKQQRRIIREDCEIDTRTKRILDKSKYSRKGRRRDEY